MANKEAPPIAEEEAAEPVKAKPTKASLCKLFSQMDAVEAMVLIVGTLCAMAHGVAQPLMIVIFGDLIDALGGTPEEVQRETERLSLIMCAVGGGALVAATLQGACFKIFSDSQTMKFRIMYFQDILHQDVGWFDTEEVSALSAEIQDDLSKIQDAFGDKFGNGTLVVSLECQRFGNCLFVLAVKVQVRSSRSVGSSPKRKSMNSAMTADSAVLRHYFHYYGR